MHQPDLKSHKAMLREFPLPTIICSDVTLRSPSFIVYIYICSRVKTCQDMVYRCIQYMNVYICVYIYIYKDIIRTSSMEFNVSAATRIVTMLIYGHPSHFTGIPKTKNVNFRILIYGATMRYDEVPYVWPYFAGIFRIT